LDQCSLIRERKSRNKVAVGEPAAGSLSCSNHVKEGSEASNLSILCLKLLHKVQLDPSSAREALLATLELILLKPLLLKPLLKLHADLVGVMCNRTSKPAMVDALVCDTMKNGAVS
jgi:hypothetical protein